MLVTEPEGQRAGSLMIASTIVRLTNCASVTSRLVMSPFASSPASRTSRVGDEEAADYLT